MILFHHRPKFHYDLLLLLFTTAPRRFELRLPVRETSVLPLDDRAKNFRACPLSLVLSPLPSVLSPICVGCEGGNRTPISCVTGRRDTITPRRSVQALLQINRSTQSLIRSLGCAAPRAKSHEPRAVLPKPQSGIEPAWPLYERVPWPSTQRRYRPKPPAGLEPAGPLYRRGPCARTRRRTRSSPFTFLEPRTGVEPASACLQDRPVTLTPRHVCF